jgi:hypothetical protein
MKNCPYTISECCCCSASDATPSKGGAGLFSNEKFLYFSSASDLWSLLRSLDLRDAYECNCSILGGLVTDVEGRNKWLEGPIPAVKRSRG